MNNSGDGIKYIKIKSTIESITKKKLDQEINLLDDGLLDSLMTLNLIEELESVFSIRIETDDFTHFNFNSVKAIHEMITRIKG